MKRVTVKLASLALVLLVAGCVNELDEQLRPRSGSATWNFIATSETSATRVALETPSNGSASVLWENGDDIQYVTASKDEPASYGIDGLDSPSEFAPITLEGDESDTWITAVCGDGVSIVDEGWAENTLTLTGVVSPEQHFTDFSQVHVGVAHAVKDSQTNAFPTDLVFYNLLGLVKFSMNLDGVAKVVFAAKETDIDICGEGSVDISFNSTTGEPSISGYGKGDNSITVYPAAGEKSFYVAMLPCVLNGFEIKFFDSNDVRLAKVTTSKQLVVERGKIVDLGALSGSLIQPDNYINLSADGTSNCYIVPSSGFYKFKATVRGCTDLPLSNAEEDTPVSARLLWESYGSKTTDGFSSVGSLIYTTDEDKVKYEDGYIYFRTKNRDGSALIAVCSASGKILWSWHIWVWRGYDLVANSQLYFNTSNNGRKYYLMDRNLGADQQVPAANALSDKRSWGMVYQWGRKDPFIGSKSTKSFVPSNGQTANLKSTADVIEQEGGSVEYAIHHPTTYIYSEETSQDWVTGSQRNDLWSNTEKTQYDPCPVGWKVPYEYVWKHAWGNKDTYMTAPQDYAGFNLGGKLGSPSVIYYPSSSYLDGTTSQEYSDPGGNTPFWSAGVSNKYGVAFFTKYWSNEIMLRSTTQPRHRGCPIRCMLESESMPTIPVTSVTLDKTSLSLKKGETKTLTATVSPSNATNGTVTWSSSNSSIATVSSGTVTGVSKGTCIIYATADGKQATCEVTVAESDIIDLSEKGTANCYIVSFPGKYSFPVNVKGNSTESVGTVKSVEILWQSDMTTTFGSNSTKVLDSSKINYTEGSGVCVFETPSTLVDGNVVLAAKNGSTILWSWHIWVCSGYDLDSAQNYNVYNNSAGTVMDRNLGALSDQSGSAKTFGLLYQWGRKDPFVGPGKTGTNLVPVATWPALGSTLWTYEASSSTTGTVDYTVKNPTAFIKAGSNNDWLYTTDNTRWSATKTKYDPCPPGWRVPTGGTSGLWAKAAKVTQTFTNDYNNYGQPIVAGKLAPEMVFYPFAGIRDASSGDITNYGKYGYYWACNTKQTGYGYSFYIGQNSEGDCYVAGGGKKAAAYSVRCVKIQ